jgi:hypothetical protein
LLALTKVQMDGIPKIPGKVFFFFFFFGNSWSELEEILNSHGAIGYTFQFYLKLINIHFAY